MEVYDKEKTDDELRSLTGISKDEESAMDTSAHNSVAQDIAEREGLTGSGSSAESGKTTDSSNTPSDEPNFYAGESESGNGGGIKNFFWSSSQRKAATLFGGGGLIATIVFIVFAVITFAGPAEIIQLSHILQIPFAHSANTDSARTKGLLRYARTGETGETRVGYLGSKIFGNLRVQLEDAGITFDTTSYSGRLNSATVDPEKMAEKLSDFSTLKGMSPAAQKAFIENKLQLPEGSLIDVVDGSGAPTGNFETAKGVTLGLKSAIALKDTTIASLDDGGIVSAIKNRVMGDYLGIPSLFHPIKRFIGDPLKNKVTAIVKQKIDAKNAQAQEDSLNDTLSSPTPTPVEAAAEADLNKQLSPAKKTIGAAVLLASTVCLIRSVAKDVPDVNRALIVAPAVAHSTSMIAKGSQFQNGNNMNSSQPNAAVSDLTDSSTGQNIWSGQALQALENPTSYGGVEMPLDLAQGFSTSTTPSGIDNSLGLGGFGAAICSPAGLVVQAGVGVALLVSGFFDAGTSWDVRAGFAAGQAGEFAATSGVFAMIKHYAVQILSDHGVVPKAFAGALGGNLLAYGAREAANIGAVSSGGVALGSNASTQLGYQEAKQANDVFESKSLSYKLFNTDDQKTLAGHLVDNINPNFRQNITNVGNGILSFSLISNMLKNLGTIFNMHVSADISQPYDWGFPQYGIPDSLLNNPAYADPYANADAVAKLLDTTGGTASPYIAKAMACFGVTISQQNGLWSVVPATDVNPNDPAYTDQNCGDITSDPNWDSIIMFVEDSRNMDAVSCFVGGSDSAQSCTNSGDPNLASSGN
ncbi:MAG TPA: hypothetical protein VIH90_06225 [Candidatus Saccharimonadales bacterium]